MIVICKDNEQMEPHLLVGEKYFVEEIKCIDNQFYYKLKGIEKLCSYFRFNIVSEIRDKKLNDLGI
jgi:hypothetical protein